MAEMIEELPKKLTGQARIYDWDTWTDGQVWQLTEGEDFQISTKWMRAECYRHARTHGLKVATRVRDNKLIVQFSQEA